jgi:hypothetical protein
MTETINSASGAAPYVVSADVAGLLGPWAIENDFSLPSQNYFDDLTKDLGTQLRTSTGLDVEIVPETEMRDGMERLVAASPVPVISLDRAYFPDNHPGISSNIDVTRAVRLQTDGNGRRTFVSAGALAPRPGFRPLHEQLEALRSSERSPITLVDDVIFSGEGAVDLVRKLRAVGRPVDRIIAGIGIREGIDLLEGIGVEVACVREYEAVADEVCERDFVAGVPMSGRTVLGEDGNHWSAPYFLPFGDPESWASIPSGNCQQFSRFCLERSVYLWSSVEAASDRLVPVSAMPRRLEGLNAQESVTMVLRQHLGEL